MPRSSGKVFKKRKGHYVQGRGKQNSESEETKAVPEHTPSDVNTSASEKKMKGLDDSYANIPYNGFRNIIMDMNILCTVFSKAVKCLQCEEVGLNLQLNENQCAGEAAELELFCTSCSYSYIFYSSKHCDSDKVKSSTFEVNMRLIYAMRCIGKGAEAARMFCGVMNLPAPPTKFAKYNNILLHATKEVCDYTMSESIIEAVNENGGDKDIAVAVDGTWQKRGYSSMNGIVTVTSVDTGKVVDVEMLSKYCLCPNKNNHLQNCKKNFEGYSGKMEVDGALAIFRRSEEKYNGVRYSTYLGDGDSKAFEAIVQENVYGNDCSVEKLECIGHVMKRMGSRLRRLKSKMKGQKLSDGKPLSGKKRLTDAAIDQLQTYYGLAIRRNLSSVEDMRQAVWAIFLHKISTDKKPQHGFCPSGSDTWCGYKKAEQLQQPYHHKNSLPVAVVEAIRPIFRDLSSPELLKKCVHGNTQNPNESINNVIWSRIPKKTFVHIETLSFGAYDAIASFNKGNMTKLDVLQKLNIEPGEYMTASMKSLDNERLRRAKYANLQRSKEKRKEKRLKRKHDEDEILNNIDNLEYGPGMF